jgi:hypothetical protein
MSSSFIIASAVLFFSGIYNSIDSVKFILTLYVSIIISEQCQQCQVKTLRSIETKSIPFNIPRSDGSFIIVALNNASVDVISTVQEQSTIAGNLSFLFYFLNRILSKFRKVRYYMLGVKLKKQVETLITFRVCLNITFDFLCE